MKPRLVLTTLFLLVFAHTFSAQESSFGDESAKTRVKKKTSAIYDNKDKTHFILTSKSYGLRSNCGAEIIAYSKESKFNRIVSKTCNQDGRMAIEYYYEDEKPIFIYRVFEFYSEKAKTDSWRNFKGLASEESRYYFAENKLRFHSYKGKKVSSDSDDGQKQRRLAIKVLNFVKSKITK